VVVILKQDSGEVRYPFRTAPVGVITTIPSYGRADGSLMSSQPASSRQVVERCIVQNTDEAWRGFFVTYGDLIRRAFLAAAGPSDWDEFQSWFPGWLFWKRKLHSAYRALLQKVNTGECPTPETQAGYLGNYLAGIVRTALADFHKDRTARETTRDPQLLAQTEGPGPPVPASPGGDLALHVRSALAKLQPELRVPLVLKEYDALGPLSEEDLHWTANLSGRPAPEVRGAIDAEAGHHRGRRFPLSSAFIGRLLGIEPGPDGRCSTVDQRVRRARLRVRTLVAESAQTGEP
jgi:hypothetical protein